MSFADRVIKATPGVAQGQSGTLFPRFFVVFFPFRLLLPHLQPCYQGASRGPLQVLLCITSSPSCGYPSIRYSMESSRTSTCEYEEEEQEVVGQTAHPLPFATISPESWTSTYLLKDQAGGSFPTEDLLDPTCFEKLRNILNPISLSDMDEILRSTGCHPHQIAGHPRCDSYFRVASRHSHSTLEDVWGSDWPLERTVTVCEAESRQL